MKSSRTIRPVFDDPNLVSAAGLVPMLRLAESAAFDDLLGGLSVPSPNRGAKTAGMLAGADSIDDLDLLRHGGMGRLFAGVRAPLTLGTFLRSFTHGHVQQLDRVNAGLLAGLTARVPGLLTGGGGGGEGIAFIDVDDTIRGVHGYATQAAGFGYTGVRGLNVRLGDDQHPDRRPGDRPGTTATGEHRLSYRRRADAGPGDRHGPRRRGDRTGPGPRRLRLLRARVRRHRATSRRLVLRDRPDEPEGHRRDQQHRVDAGGGDGGPVADMCMTLVVRYPGGAR